MTFRQELQGIAQLPLLGRATRLRSASSLLLCEFMGDDFFLEFGHLRSLATAGGQVVPGHLVKALAEAQQHVKAAGGLGETTFGKRAVAVNMDVKTTEKTFVFAFQAPFLSKKVEKHVQVKFYTLVPKPECLGMKNAFLIRSDIDGNGGKRKPSTDRFKNPLDQPCGRAVHGNAEWRHARHLMK